MCQTKIIVAGVRESRYRRGFDHFCVVEQNTVTGRAAAALKRERKDRESPWIEIWEPSWERGTRYYKKDAVPLAKRLAGERGQKFNIKSDLIDADELRDGPEHTCLVCKRTVQRSWKDFICESCRDDAEAGRATRAGRRQHLIRTGSEILTRVNDFHENRAGRFAELIARVGGTRVGEIVETWVRSRYEGMIDIRRTPRNASSTVARAIQTTDEQAQAMLDLVLFTNEMIEIAYAEGRDDGERLLVRLADGDLTIGDYEDRSVRKQTEGRPVRAYFKLASEEDT